MYDDYDELEDGVMSNGDVAFYENDNYPAFVFGPVPEESNK